ncbi:MAG: AAA family ATPase [Candidatus Omnitrophica bacterium]|nr:AAA family ATPase [Candidatus Omnitrophota bacterium]
MYTTYWQLKEKPFELSPDPRYIYYSKSHEEALTKLIYTVRDLKGAMLLTGLYGCGKTAISRVFLNELMGSKYEIALITNPRLSANELLTEVIYQLGGGLHEGKAKGELLRLFNEILFSNLNLKKETILVIDEAQAIEKIETFEELRLLLNFQQNDRFLITLILIGQDELRRRLKELPQLRQRLIIQHHIDPLGEHDVQEYIEHRLKIAGAARKIFDPQAKNLIYRYSSGIPRLINGIADMALLEGFSQNKEMIDEEIILKVVKDSDLQSIRLGEKN